MEQLKLIGISGKKGSGKDTLGNYLVKKYGYKQYAYADSLKNVCRELFSFDEEQLNGTKKEVIDEYWKVTPRHTFQFMGDILRDNAETIFPGIGDTLLVEVMRKKILSEWERCPEKKIIITDVRFQNELNLIKELGGTIIKIERNIESTDKHKSETTVDLLKADYIFTNNSTKEYLYSCVEEDIFSYYREMDSQK
jgi:adenylate kinase family enzyme